MTENNRMRVILGVLLILLVAATATATTRKYFDLSWHRASQDDPEEVIEKDFKLPSGSTVNLRSDMGSIQVNGGSNTVHVRVIKVARNASENRARELFDRFKVSFNQNTRGLEIEGDNDNGWNNNGRLSVRYEITVPNNINVELKTAGGSISVSDVDGTARLSTAGGSISLENISGDVEANTAGGSISAERIESRARLNTSGGSIELSDMGADVFARTSGGSISARGVRGNLDVRTSGGSIELEDLHGSVSAATSGGSVDAEVVEQPSGPISLETSAGTVSLRVPDEIKANISANASGGRVRSDIPITGNIERDQIRGTINGGGPMITLRSHGGSVQIEGR